MITAADSTRGDRRASEPILQATDRTEYGLMAVPDSAAPNLVDDLDPGDQFGPADSGVFLDGPGVVDDADVDGRSLSLFEGDEGTLTYEQRRTLVFLIKHRYISAEQNPREWGTLMNAQVPLRSRLNDLFLDLHIDPHAQIAFKRQAVPEGDGRFPTLLHDIAHTREETILLIFLRQRFRSERAGGADAVLVDRGELLDAVARFRPPDANDRSGDARKVENAVGSLERSGILLKTADDQRLRIAPVIEVLLPLARLHELLNALLTLNGNAPVGVGDSTWVADRASEPVPDAAGGQGPGWLDAADDNTGTTGERA